MTPDGDRTRLSLAESGFPALVNLAAREATASHESHSAGWTDVLQALARLAEQR